MKILKEFTIILLIIFFSDTLSKTFSLPLPGSIIGMLLLLGLLLLKIVKVETLKTSSTYMLDNLAFFFLPAGVGIISSFNLLKGNTIKIIFIIIISTLVVLLVTGYTVQGLIALKNKRNIGKYNR